LAAPQQKFKKVFIEISNICNLQCSFCPPVERAKKVMQEPEFRRVIAQVAPLTEEVCLHLMGEPLGHPHLEEIISACADAGVPVNVTTNGVLLTEQRKQLLLHGSVRQVNISVHSFEANFGMKDVEPYMDRVINFVDRALGERPDLYINLRLWDLDDPECLSEKSVSIRRYLQEHFAIDLNAMRIDVRRRKNFLIKQRVYLNFDSRFVWPSPTQPLRQERGFCHAMTHHIGIHADGTVVPCCLDKEAILDLGNVLTGDHNLEEILAGPRAAAMRTGFAQGKLVEDLCRRCQFIQRFDRKAEANQVSS